MEVLCIKLIERFTKLKESILPHIRQIMSSSEDVEVRSK
mgnify:CR=1 FL=1